MAEVAAYDLREDKEDDQAYVDLWNRQHREPGDWAVSGSRLCAALEGESIRGVIAAGGHTDAGHPCPEVWPEPRILQALLRG